MNVTTVGRELLVHEHEADYGRLYETDPDMCCSIRKVWPLERALRLRRLGRGVRRAESATRARTHPSSPGTRAAARSRSTRSPRWTDEQVEAYVAEHGILVNPLREIGYTSIGCAPCTRPVAPGEDPRAGRWAG